MNFKWFGPLALLAALVIGDQIRINRPGHKYRLTVEVETPDGRQIGVRRAGGPSRPRLQPRRPDPHRRRRRLRRSRRRQESRRAAGASRREARSRRHQLCGVARLYGSRRQAGVVQRDEPDDRRRAGHGRADPGARDLRRSRPIPRTARTVAPDDAEAVLGTGYRLAGDHRRGGAERLLAARFRRRRWASP